jgi:DnaD/phage-associated family protein
MEVMMNNIKSFTLYREYYDLITLLSDKEQANVSLAILKYMFDDTEIKLNDRESKVFINLKRPLEKSKNKSQNANKIKSKQNQNEIKINSNEDAHQDVNVNVNVYGNVKDIYSFIEDNFNRTLSPIEYEQISEWEDNELTRYAIKQAVLNGAYSIKYITRILESYKAKNIKTIHEAQRDEQNFKNKNGKVITTEWLNKDIESLEASDEDIRKLEERMRRVKNEN